MRKSRFLCLVLGSAAVAVFVTTNALSSPGDLYVAEAATGIIYKFTLGGAKSTFATGIYQPTALAFDRDGNLFVANSGAGTPPMASAILKFTPGGTENTFATTPSNGLLSLAFDGAGNLFASTGFILEFAPDGKPREFSTAVQNVWPLAFDKLGNLYAGVNSPSVEIVKIAPDGTSSTFHSFSAGGSITGMAFDASGDLFAAVGTSILRVKPDGSSITFAAGDFLYPLAFDGTGNLFAALYAFNARESAIVKFTPDGTKTTFAFGPLLPSAFAFEPVTEKLRNISARGFVGTSDEVLIGGFIMGGNALSNNAAVVRALGPSLANARVSNALQDPVLELHNSSGALIASNDNWQETQKEQITATGLAPTDTKESAIFTTLPAGNYTAIVRGAGETTGVALLEVYSVNQ